MENDENLKMAYLAGILDGDGSFSIIKRVACMKSENRRIPRYRPCIQLYNLSEEMTRLLKEYLGGNLGKRKSQKEGWKEQCYWYCVGFKSCEYALKKILPYLVVKKEIAGNLLDFCKKALSFYKKHNLDEKVLHDREKDYIQAKMLNDKRDLSPESIAKPASSIPSQADWAYMAGLMDSDGSFQITRSIKPRRKSYSYELRATIQMLSIKGINFIYEKTGLGHVALITRGRGSNCRQLFHYRWVITNHHQLQEFIVNISPYVSYRKEQCKVILEYLLTCIEGKKSDLAPIRNDLYEKIKHLNLHGVFKPSLIDLEARKGDKAEGESHGDRLSEMGSQEQATVRAQ